MKEMGPKNLLILCFAACLQLSSALMKIQEFYDTDFPRCYDTNAQDSRRVSLQNIHGQPLPLPNSIETFVSLIERYESLNPTEKARDTATKLLQSFRIDDMDPDLQDRQLREGGADLQNDIKRAILNVQPPVRYRFQQDDFSDDEKCAIHIMLSHTVNDSLVDGEAAEFSKNKAKKPFEIGVVSLNSRWDHAFALGRVLLGIAAADLPKEVKANEVLRALRKDTIREMDDVALNPVFAVTLGDLVSRLAPKNIDDDILILQNGLWDDLVCPIAYQLEDNNGGSVTLSEIRGAVDGLIIGRKIQDDLQTYADVKLSQILRMYYGINGLLDNERATWCKRERIAFSFTELEGEMISFNKLFKASTGGIWSEKITDQVRRTLTEIRNSAFKTVDQDPECSASEMSPDRKYASPNNIFVIMDYSPAKLQFQREVIGNLSTNFAIRPRGNLMGVYTNIKPTQQHMLDTIVKNNGTSGCPSCFAKYYYKQTSREDETDVFRDLNDTLTTFEEEYDELEEKYQEAKAGSPGKVLLYFNFGNPSDTYDLQNALWDIKRYFGGITILAVGDNKDMLKSFTENEDLDIFTGSTNAEKTAKDIKERLKTVPAEFQYKDCNQSTTAKEAENKQEAYIPYNKIQYWAMYPRYFLKSFGIKLMFRAQEGSTITVCFTRWFRNFIDRKDTECKTSNGEEIAFWTNNPCKRRNVFNCDPFFFSVEGKKSPIETCKSLRCNTPRDIRFEFQHEGISCNMASLFSLSNLAVLLAAFFFFWQRH